MFYYSLDPDGGPKDSDFWNFGLEEAAINDIGAVMKFIERVRVLNPIHILISNFGTLLSGQNFLKLLSKSLGGITI